LVILAARRQTYPTRGSQTSSSDAVPQVDDRGHPVREVAERLAVSTNAVYTWQKQFSREAKVIQNVNAQADGIRRLTHDPARVTKERDILQKGDRIFRQGTPVKSAVIAERRPVFAVRAMCRMLLVHPSGFFSHGCESR
jgi:transposase